MAYRLRAKLITAYAEKESKGRNFWCRSSL